MDAPILDRELSIMKRVLAPDDRGFSTASAKALLEMGLCEADRERFAALVEAANRRELTVDEMVEAESYRRVESWLVMMKSKARKSIG